MGKVSRYTAKTTSTLVRIDKITPAGVSDWRYSDCKTLRARIVRGDILKQSELRKIYREL
jgi:hypothetical protein